MTKTLKNAFSQAIAKSHTLPAVSVITPFYNRSYFLRSVIETLERQTFIDLELIIVDDGSEDDLASAVGNIETAVLIRFVRLDRNVGAASARNAGIEQARGRYIAFLDSDDQWDPNKLRRQFEQLESAPDRNVLVSLTRILVFGDRTYVAPRRLLTRNSSVGQYLFQSGGIIQSSMMFMAADLAKSVRFVEGTRGHDDWSFALRLEEAGAQFEMLPEVLTIYNDGRGRVRRSPLYSKDRFDWLEQWRRHLGEGPYLAARATFASNMSGHRSLNLLHMIVVAFVRGAIPTWRAAYYAATWAFPSLRTFGVLANETRLSLHRSRIPGPPPKNRIWDGVLALFI